MAWTHTPDIAFLLFCILSCLSAVRANFEIGKVDSSYDAATDKVVVKWSDDGTYPPISSFLSMTFLLCTGSNSQVECPVSLAGPLDLSSITDKQYSIPLSSVVSQGANGPYFIQVNGFMGAGGTGGQSISYTDRFELTGMKGVAIKPFSGGDTSPPGDSNQNLPQDQVSTLAGVPYTAQTGRFRYAPMQLQPGTKVTKALNKATRRYPTSHVTYFSSNIGEPSIYSTITPGWSYVFSSMTNYAKTNPPPTVYYKATAVIASSIAAKMPEKTKRWA